MKIIFAGTPAVAQPSLAQLIASPHEVVGVLTRPPARQGRGRTLHDSAVGAFAKEAGLLVIETSKPGETDTAAQIQALDADLGVVVAYGAILPPSVLSIPRLGWINLHFSDLPRWRGAAPVQHAIRAGDPQTATSVFQLEKGLDTGPVFSRITVDLQGTETSGSLLEDLAQIGAAQIVEVVDALQQGTAEAVPQAETGLTVAPRLAKADGFIDFTASAEVIDAQIRSVTPSPGAWTVLEDGKTLKLGPVQIVTDVENPGQGRVASEKKRLLVGTGDGVVQLGAVAPAGKGWMDAVAWWRGARLDEEIIVGAAHV